MQNAARIGGCPHCRRSRRGFTNPVVLLAAGMAALFAGFFATTPHSIQEPAFSQPASAIIAVATGTTATPKKVAVAKEKIALVLPKTAQVIAPASQNLAASIAGGVSEDELTQKLQGLETRLRGVISATDGATSPEFPPIASGGVWNAIAGSNRIDQLTGTKLNNVTVNGVSGLTLADLPSGVGVSPWLTSGSDTYYTTGNVGIGTSTPQTALSVAGDATIASTTNPTEGTLYFGNTGASLFYNSSDFNLFNGSLYTDAGRIVAQGADDTQALGTRFNKFDGTYFLGASDAASPDLLFINNAAQERARLTDSGNFGIGTTSPTNKLEVAGNTFLGGNVTATGTLAVAGAATLSSTLDISGAITSTATGHSTFPYASSTALTVSGTAYLNLLNVTGNTTLANATTTNLFSSTASSTNLFAQSAFLGTLAVRALTQGSILFAAAGGTISQDNSNFFWDAANHRLGIGTNSPPEALSVSGKVWATNVQATNQFYSNSASAATPGYSSAFDGATGIFFPESGILAFGTAGTERARITSTGNLAIGTTTASYPLDVFGVGNFAAYARASYFIATSTTQASTLPYASTTVFSVAGSAYFAGSGVWTSGGSVGIGTSSPSASLAVSGGASNDATVYSSAITNGSYTVPAGVTQIIIKAWGAGGGAGYGSSAGAGGGGGFAQTTIAVTPGQTLTVKVGGGGGGTTSSTTGSGGTNGGGSGGSTSESNSTAGGGGGYSGVFLSGTPLAVAGGGGGGGDTGEGSGGGGGAGGGTSGGAGGNAGGSAGGGGGTSSAGGAGGPNSGWCDTNGQGDAGSAYQGGTGLGVDGCISDGGGGGGGYYGGGGASIAWASGGGGGGGGSGYVTGSATSLTAGSGSSAANTSDAYYGGGAGAGGSHTSTNGNPGTDGRVVIITVSSTAVQFSGSNGTSIATFLGNGYAGIGTTTPWGKLSVLATDNAIAPQFVVASSSNISFMVDQLGRIGINTSAPANYLAISTSTNLGTISLEFDGSTQYGGGFNDKRSGATSDTMFNFMRNTTQVGSIAETNTATTYNTVSDRRLKENIATTTAGLATLMQIPVADFDFINDPSHTREQGFIAQQLYPIYPEAVTPNGDNGIVPLSPTSTPWSVDYGRLTPLIVQSVRDIADLSDTFKNTLVAWMSTGADGIGDLFANNLHATNELCVGSTCVTPAQFQAMVAAAGQSGGSGSSGSTSNAAATTSDVASTPPIIDINGDNPAYITVGSPYVDLGAVITGPTDADKNLGIETFLNDALVDNIVIDTTAAATDTIDYVAKNSAGVATSTRTVIVESAGEGAASTTDMSGGDTTATSTDQTATTTSQ